MSAARPAWRMSPASRALALWQVRPSRSYPCHGPRVLAASTSGAPRDGVFLYMGLYQSFVRAALLLTFLQPPLPSSHG